MLPSSQLSPRPAFLSPHTAAGWQAAGVASQSIDASATATSAVASRARETANSHLRGSLAEGTISIELSASHVDRAHSPAGGESADYCGVQLLFELKSRDLFVLFAVFDSATVFVAFAVARR